MLVIGRTNQGVVGSIPAGRAKKSKVYSGHIGNGLYRRHGQHFRGERVVGTCQATGLVIEEAQVVFHEANEPYFIAHLLDADVLAGEHGAEIDFAPADADAAAFLQRQLIRLPIRSSTAIGEPLESAVFISLEDLVAGLARNIELAAQRSHRFAIEQPGYKSKSFIHFVTLLPGHFALPQRPEVLPMSPE